MFASSSAATGERAIRSAALIGSRASELVAQLLHLLENPLELVLGAVKLPVQTGDVGAAGEAEVAQHEVEEIVRHARDRREVLGRERDQLTEARPGYELFEGLGRAGFGLL